MLYRSLAPGHPCPRDGTAIRTLLSDTLLEEVPESVAEEIDRLRATQQLHFPDTVWADYERLAADLFR